MSCVVGNACILTWVRRVDQNFNSFAIIEEEFFCHVLEVILFSALYDQLLHECYKFNNYYVCLFNFLTQLIKTIKSYGKVDNA